MQLFLSRMKRESASQQKPGVSSSCSDLPATLVYNGKVATVNDDICLASHAPEASSWPQSIQPVWKLRAMLLLGFVFTSVITVVLLLPSNPFGPSLQIGSVFSRSQLTIDNIKVAATSYIADTGILKCFQVHQPVFLPASSDNEGLPKAATSGEIQIGPLSKESSCTVLLMDHSFGISYGKPFIGNYSPPACPFNRVVMNLTVTSKGRQFDRLAIMYFGDAEIFRTSTAEPTLNGIEWTYLKDMSAFMYFWKQPQTIIFDLGNLIDNVYNGAFNATLTATFFTTPGPEAAPASMILPVSARKGASNQASVFSLPEQNATNSITLPRNINRAVFTISACGQAAEEFWWGNVLSSHASTFNSTTGPLLGYSSFREVQLYIDGQLAGVEWPFPVIFTGGVVPGLWRPLVGIDAFDLREHEIDITPWLGVLCDGVPHSFEIRVAGIMETGETSGNLTRSVGSSWLVTGKIFLWLDEASSITTGTAPVLDTPAPGVTLSSAIGRSSNGTNENLSENTRVQRTLSIKSNLMTQHNKFESSWVQVLSYSNVAGLTQRGTISVNTFKTIGADTAAGFTPYNATYEYPLVCNQSYIIDPKGSGNFTLAADIKRGKTLNIHTASVFANPALSYARLNGISSLTKAQLANATVSTTQEGTASYAGSPSTGTSSGSGSTKQNFVFVAGGSGPELYTRDVKVVNGSVVHDEEKLFGQWLGSDASKVETVGGGYMDDWTIDGPKEAIGRGAGTMKSALVQSG